jgi:hypothetical protein
MQIKRARDCGPLYDTYENTVINLGGTMIHVFSEMSAVGSLMDLDYLILSQRFDSPLNKKIQSIKHSFSTLDSVKKANKILIKEESEKAPVYNSLFGDKEPWVFDINKVRPAQVLFFDVLKLRPLKVGKSGRPSIDSTFLSYYEGINEVAMLSRLRSAEKIATTYFKDYLQLVKASPDQRIRATTDFLGVVTGRTSSYNPNFQNIPEHGPDAHLIKAAFIAPKGGLLLKVDYNAHEVRMWGNVAKDRVIGEAFSEGMSIRRKIRIWHIENSAKSAGLIAYMDKIGWKKMPYKDKKILVKKAESKQARYILNLYLDLEAKGDVHKRNYEFFYGIPAYNVTPTQRQAVKATVFGTLYDKSAGSLGVSINQKAANDILYDPKLSQEEIKERLQPFYDQGAELQEKMFDTFRQGKQWIDSTKSFAQANLCVKSPVGFIRHLPGYYTNIRTLTAMMNRRGPNSIIQGLSSNIAYTSARVFQGIVNECAKYGITLDAFFNKMVHDSLEQEIRNLENLAITLYYLEHSLTTLVTAKLKEIYGFNLYINLEAEFKMGINLSNMITYNFTKPSFIKILEESLGKSKDASRIIKKACEIFDRVNKYRLEELKMANGYRPEKVVTLKPSMLPSILKDL